MRPPVISLFVLLVGLATACGPANSSEGANDAGATAVTSPAGTVEASTSPTTEPSPTATPVPGTTDLSRSLWSGPLGLFPLAIELRPGREPATEPWQVAVSGSPFSCEAMATTEGWLLDHCEGDFPNLELTIEVPRLADATMTATVTDLSVDPVDVRVSSLQLVEDRDEERLLNVTRLWRTRALTDGGTSDVWSAGGVVFAPNFGGYVELLSAASGERLSVIDLVPVVGAGSPVPAVLDVKARDGYVYLATSSNGVFIYDVIDASEPEFAGWYVVPPVSEEIPEGVWNIHNIFLSPDRELLYLINQSGLSQDLRLLDVSDPTAPFEVGRYSVPNPLEDPLFPHDVNVVTRDGREIAYVNYWDAGLRILDTTDPAAILELGVWDEGEPHSHAGWPFELAGRSYYAHGGEGYDQGMTVLDITDPAAPLVVGEYESRHGISIHNLEVRDGVAYIAYYIDGLRVVDLSDPAQPVEIAHYDTLSPSRELNLFSGAWGVRLEGDRVFLSDRQSGIFAFTVQLPESELAAAP